VKVNVYKIRVESFPFLGIYLIITNNSTEAITKALYLAITECDKDHRDYLEVKLLENLGEVNWIKK